MDLLRKSLKILECDRIECNDDNLNISFYLNKKEIIISTTFKKNKLSKITTDFISDHLFRLLKKNNLLILNDNNIYDFISFVNDHGDLFSYCTICGENISSLCISSCRNCINNYMSLVTGNTIIDYYNDDKMALNMIILTAYACMKHPKRKEIFKPFPSFISSCEELESSTKFSYQNFNSLLEIINKVNNDYELFDMIGVTDYSFLKFVVLTNITNIKSDLLFNKNNRNIFDQKIAGNIFEQNEVMTFQVRHDPLTEEKFTTDYPQYLFHGSTLANWYSILRNGIKVFSGTGLMAHGAAHGTGIYLSDNLNVSFNYGSDKYCASNLYVIGVVQILGNKKDYLKSSGIYVLPNEDALLLRYIVVLKGGKDLNFITNYFINQRESEVSKASFNFSLVKEKRIDYDYEKINKLAEKYEWVVSRNENNIKITTQDTSIGILYPKDYPSSPPFVWLIETSRKINNVKILESGGIIDEDLLYNKWKSNTKVHKIIKNITESISNKEVKKITNNCQYAYEKYIEKIKNFDQKD